MPITAREIGDFVRRHRPLIVDIVVAAVLMGLMYPSNTTAATGEDPTYAFPFQELPGFDVAFALWCIVAFLVLSLARTRPGFVCWAVPALLYIHVIFFPITGAAITVTFYGMMLLGRYAPPKWRIPVWIAAMVGTAVAILFRNYVVYFSLMHLVAIVGVWMVLGFFWFLGTRNRSRDLEIKSLRDRAQLAAISERTRIAREMHDIVAHSLTAIVVQADGGRYAGKKDPEKAISALETIGDTARQSLDQMRDLLSVLRDPELEQADDDNNRHTSPGTSAIPQLIREARSNGLRVSFDEQGEPYELDPTRQLTVYRIVQECLTNALRYSGSGVADVHFTWGAREFVVVVHNEVDGPRRGSVGAGRGLTGIRERAELHGGRIEVDERDGFTVTARIPRR